MNKKEEKEENKKRKMSELDGNGPQEARFLTFFIEQIWAIYQAGTFTKMFFL